MGEYQTVKLSVEDRTAIITIDNPPANAFNTQQMLDLEAAFNEVVNDEQVKVIIITGAGQFFIAGADIKEMAGIAPDEAYGIIRKGQLVFANIERSRKPVIAAMNGRRSLSRIEEACRNHRSRQSIAFFLNQAEWDSPEILRQTALDTLKKLGKVPVITAHQGIVAGTSMANSNPSNTAFPSPMVMGLLATRLIASSQIIAVDTDRQTTPKAGIP